MQTGIECCGAYWRHLTLDVKISMYPLKFLLQIHPLKVRCWNINEKCAWNVFNVRKSKLKCENAVFFSQTQTVFILSPDLGLKLCNIKSKTKKHRGYGTASLITIHKGKGWAQIKHLPFICQSFTPLIIYRICSYPQAWHVSLDITFTPILAYKAYQSTCLFHVWLFTNCICFRIKGGNYSVLG